jgi:hypothetical protein
MNEQVHKKILNFARIYTKCNQPEDSLKHIQDIAKLKKEDLTIEEINILFGSINALIQKSKKQWEIICAVESNELKKKSKFKNVARDAKEAVYKEIQDYTIQGQGIIDHYLIKGAKTPELEALYYMHKGDLQRVVISITPVDYDREIVDLKDKAEKFYRRAYEICARVDDLNDIKAGIILHYSIYLFEENKDAKGAYNVANPFYEKTTKMLKKIKNSSDTYLELNNILVIMKQNIDNWEYIIANTPEENEEDNVNMQSKDLKKE